MELPIDPENGHSGEYMLPLNKSLYGLKQTVNCFECLKQALEFHEFFQLIVDPFVFYKDGMVVLVYVDDCIVIFQGKAHH